MKFKDLKVLPYLLILLKHGVSTRDYAQINLSKLASEVGVTPQNLSKVLKKLEDLGYIEKKLNTVTQIRLTEKAQEVLRYVMEILSREFFESFKTIKLVGQVISGIGEGKFYVSLNGYMKQFIEKLGFKPYPGTLNVKLKPEYVKYRILLEKLPGIYIQGFSDGVRTYGGVKCFKATIKDVPAAILLIERTHHTPDIIEVISPYKLRDVLNLRDGDEIEIYVQII